MSAGEACEGYRGGVGRGAARTGYALLSYQRARISFEFRVCVTWMRMPRTALELPDSSEQKTRLVVRDDPPLHVERVEHPSKPRLRAVTHRYDAVAGPRIAQYECYRGLHSEGPTMCP